MDKVYRSLQDFDSIGNRADTRLAKGSDTSGHERHEILEESLAILAAVTDGQVKRELSKRWGNHASSVAEPDSV